MSKRILLVDDEENALVALAIILQEDGYDVVIAGTEEQAISRLDQWNFDFIITDLFLFRKSCLDFLNKIKSLDTRTPVILTSGHDSAERYIEESQPLDIMLLSKPIKYDELKRLIDTTKTNRGTEGTSNCGFEELSPSRT